MSSVFIIVQTRESDKLAIDLLKHLAEKGDVKIVQPIQDIDPNTVMLSFKDVSPGALARIIADSKQWSEDVGFVFLVNEDTIYTSVSQTGEMERENAAVISMLEL